MPDNEPEKQPCVSVKVYLKEDQTTKRVFKYLVVRKISRLFVS
jgi:hypothetical protein